MEITVDFSQKVVTNNDLIPDGTYSAIIDKVDHCVRNGKDYLNWQFSLTDENYLNRKVWMSTYLQSNSVWTAERAFDALGWQVSEKVEDGKDENGTPIITKRFRIDIEPVESDKEWIKGILVGPDVEGMDCKVVVIIDKYNADKPTNRVDKVVDENKATVLYTGKQETSGKRKVA